MPAASISLKPPSPRPDPAVHRRSVRVLHTSDVHVGSDDHPASDGAWPEPALAGLARMVALAHAQQVGAIVIAGDLFDHNRVEASRVELVAGIFASAQVPIVILPGNHDPYMAGGVYLRCRGLFPTNVHILSRAEGEVIALPDAGLQIWGRAHVDYDDCSPAEGTPAWHADETRPLWRIAMAHGLYVRSAYETRFSYRIHANELADLQAHYIALGHLEGHEAVGDGRALAYYPGTLDRSGGATLIDLAPDGIGVQHMPFPEATVVA